MAIYAVANRPTGDAAVADLHNEEKLAVFVVSAVQKVRAGPITGSCRQLRALLT